MLNNSVEKTQGVLILWPGFFSSSCACSVDVSRSDAKFQTDKMSDIIDKTLSLEQFFRQRFAKKKLAKYYDLRQCVTGCTVEDRCREDVRNVGYVGYG